VVGPGGETKDKVKGQEKGKGWKRKRRKREREGGREIRGGEGSF